MLKFARPSSKQDGKLSGGKTNGRSFTINSTQQQGLIKELNKEDVTHIDLQRDLLTEVIKPTESDSRVMDISLDAIKFDKKFKSREGYKITVELDNGGILRKDDQFYFFETYNENDEALSSWSWDVYGDDDIRNKSEPSDRTAALVEFVTNGKRTEASDSDVFTMPPSWTNMKISLEAFGTNDEEGMPNITEITFRVRCSYTKMSNNQKKVLDLRLKDAPHGTFLKVVTSKDTTLTAYNYYNVFPKRQKVTVSVIPPKDWEGNDMDTKNVFKQWTRVNGKQIPSSSLKQKSLTFDMKNSAMLTAAFKPKAAPVQGAVMMVYSDPSSEAPALGMALDKGDYRIVEDNVKDGFQRVFFGMVEGYIKVDNP